MTVYNFNQGIGWASSGQCRLTGPSLPPLGWLKLSSDFILNIEHYTTCFKDEEVICPYQAFSDFRADDHTLAD